LLLEVQNTMAQLLVIFNVNKKGSDFSLLFL